MRIRLAHLFVLCAVSALAQAPGTSELPDYQKKAMERAIEGLRSRLAPKPPAVVNPQPIVKPRINLMRKEVCSVPLVNVLPQAPSPPMPQFKPRDDFHMPRVPLPAPPCEEPAKK